MFEKAIVTAQVTFAAAGGAYTAETALNQAPLHANWHAPALVFPFQMAGTPTAAMMPAEGYEGSPPVSPVDPPPRPPAFHVGRIRL